MALDVEKLYAEEAKERSLANLKQNASEVADLRPRDDVEPRPKARDRKSVERAAKAVGTSGRNVSTIVDANDPPAETGGS